MQQPRPNIFIDIQLTDKILPINPLQDNQLKIAKFRINISIEQLKLKTGQIKHLKFLSSINNYIKNCTYNQRI